MFGTQWENQRLSCKAGFFISSYTLAQKSTSLNAIHLISSTSSFVGHLLMLFQLSWQWPLNTAAAISEMFKLHHETRSEPNQKLSTCPAAIKRLRASTHTLTSCMTPAPVRTESCQRHTADTTCYPASPYSRPITALTSLTPSLG